MRRRQYLSGVAAAAAAGASGCLSGPAETLRAATPDGFHVGSAVNGHLDDDGRYRETLAREFDAATPEGAMKWAALRPSRETFAFDRADRIAAFADEHDMYLRGHTLVWHHAVPTWLREGEFSGAELDALLREHVETVAGRYRDDVDAWDVVNEPVTAGGLRETLWKRGLGEGYVERALRLADEAAPDTPLFLNEYGVARPNAKFDALYDLAAGLLDAGAPLDGVGVQLHTTVDTAPTPAQFREVVRRFGDLGLDVHVTEMDVGLYTTEPGELERQAAVYAGVLETCLEEPNCESFVTWGFTDRYTWLQSDYYDGAASKAPLPLDESYDPKPAYEAMLETLREHGSGALGGLVPG
ncbi:MAG: endo-1,4-beta-xylanase [Halobacteriaceae archaeon]